MQTIGQRLVWASRAELALARREHDLALDITERLITSAANLAGERVIPSLWKLRGEALLALQRVPEAEATLRSAQESARSQGLQPLLWRISLALGRLYQIQKRHEEARQAIDSAREIIEGLAAPIQDEKLREIFLINGFAALASFPPTHAAPCHKTGVWWIDRARTRSCHPDRIRQIESGDCRTIGRWQSNRRGACK